MTLRRPKSLLECTHQSRKKRGRFSALTAAGYFSVGLLIVLCLFKAEFFYYVITKNNFTTTNEIKSSPNSIHLRNGMPLNDPHKLMDSDDLLRIFGSNRAAERYEIIYVLQRKKQGVEQEYKFAAFGKNFTIKAKPSIPFPIYETVAKDGVLIERIALSSPDSNCHFRHVDSSLFTAAINHCSAEGILGYLVNDDGKLYEIKPLSDYFRKILVSPVGLDNFKSIGAHVIRCIEAVDLQGFERNFPKSLKGNLGNKRIELAIFVDYETLNDFVPFVNPDVNGKPNLNEFRELVLAFINGVQALFHHPSLGQQVDLSIIKIQITRNFKSQASDSNGLLADFCKFQAIKNPTSDTDWKHWDLAILFTSKAFSNKNKISVLTHHGGVCSAGKNCMVSHFGTKTHHATVPSVGFDGIFPVAQGIARSLGLGLDGIENKCTQTGTIMSPTSQGFGHEWSTCSALELAALPKQVCLTDFPQAFFWDLQQSKYGDRPGQWFSADNQCQFLLRDKSAKAVRKVDEVCRSVTCKFHNNIFSAGPALAGTACGKSKWCVGGRCVAVGS